MNKFYTFNAIAQGAFNNDENDFDAFRQLLNDYTDKTIIDFDGKNRAEAHKKIVSTLRAAIGCNENSTKTEIRQALRRNQAIVFDILEDTVASKLITGWQDDPFSKYIDERNLQMGDRNDFFIEDNSMLSVMEIAGGHHDIIRQRIGAGTHTSIPTKWVGLKVYAETLRLLQGLEDWATLVSKVVEAYNNYIRQTIYDTMIAYSSQLVAPFKKTGNLSADDLRNLCEDIELATGKQAIIMGTRSALRKVTGLQNTTYISDDMKNEHYRTGMLGLWEGTELVEIPQGFKFNNTSEKLITNNTIWVMPVDCEKFIKLVNEGDVQIYQVNDATTNMDESNEYEFKTKMGVGIIFNMAFGIYDFT